jgi:RimJ/RimL family protein N-acetyltransferase
MNIQPVTLEGRMIRLEPLDERHAEDLSKVVSLELLKYSFPPDELSPEGYRVYIRKLNARVDMQPFAKVLVETGKTVGMTTYMDIHAEHRWLEIGSTWIAEPYQGTNVNPESKYLLLRHAFEDQNAMRVQLKTDSRNKQSQRAIEKLGAKYEGTLRNHYIMPDGHIRHTVMYSIIDSEWQDVKTQLEQRLGYAP